MAKTGIDIKDTILFVDDEKICHSLVELIIPNFTKYKVIGAYSGTEAISLAQRYANNICLILSDIMLPNINGYEIYKMFAEDKKLKSIPFIFQSGLDFQEEELKNYIAEKKIPILYKPYKQTDLLEIISRVLAATADKPYVPL